MGLEGMARIFVPVFDENLRWKQSSAHLTVVIYAIHGTPSSFF